MKISIAFSILILALGAMFGWHVHQRLANSRETHDKLAAEAPQFGISIDSKNPADPVRFTKRSERGNKDAEARLVAKDFIDFAQEMEAAEKIGGSPEESEQRKISDFMARVMSLDVGQLKILIAEIRDSVDLKEEARNGLIGFCFTTMANDDPQAALAVFIASRDLLRKSGVSQQAVSNSLANWAKDDPMAALAWVRENEAKFPDFIDDSSKRGLISGAAVNDPKLAFRLIGELGMKNDSGVPFEIMDVAKTPEQRTAALAALREHVGGIQDESRRNEAAGNGGAMLVDATIRDGFDSAVTWLAKASLTPPELDGFVGRLTHSIKIEETGKWIEWMGENLPAGKANGDIRSMVRHWTTDDYQAAGKWLAATPDGPAKNISIRSYAETVANYVPESAAQWAMTLPPGQDRDETLKHIYHAWPEKDDAAKEVFAKEHGIK